MLSKNAETLRQQVRQRVLETRLLSIPEAIRSDVQKALQEKAEQRSEVHRYLVEKFAATPEITEADIDASFTETEKATLKANADQRATLSAQKKSHGVIQALWDVGPPPVSHVHRRGIVETSGNFGHSGSQPSHPELLDWLAVDFMEHGYNTSGKMVWSSGWLPAVYPGTEFSSSGSPVLHLHPSRPVSADSQERSRRFLQELNATHLRNFPGEFGRLPITGGADGRDHNRHAFSTIMAGGGFRAGYIHGATDEFGYESVENRVSVPDLHATILNQLGIDHRKLTLTHSGRPERLTDPDVTGASVVEELLA